MTQSDQVGNTQSAIQPGDAVLVFALGSWLPGVVIDMVDAGRVLVRYQRVDGELAERAFSRSSVVAADTL
jgi:hypothetical protein